MIETIASLDSIARWEKEVNTLGGYTEMWGLASASEEDPVSLTCSTGTRVLFHYADGRAVFVDLTENVVMIPTSQIVSFDLYDGEDIVDTFALNEGTGSRVFGAVEVCDISTASAWIVCQATRTWQDKIDLAHFIVQGDILTALYNRMHEYTDSEIISSISNVQTFALAVDLKALELIFADLANSGFNQLYQAKATEYTRRYRSELDSALRRINIDMTGSGYGPNRIVTQGQLSR